MKEFILNYKKYIIIAVLIIATVLIIYFWGKHKGKAYTPQTVALPNDTKGKAGSIDPKVFNPGTYTDALYNDLDTVFSAHSAKPYQDALTLSNTQLVAVHNDWNKRYYNDFGKKTLRGAIEGEWSTWNFAWQAAVNALVDKLKSLGL